MSGSSPSWSACRADRAPGCESAAARPCCSNPGPGRRPAVGYLGPFLAAALMASYVLYGFDTAGTLAEETDRPRRRAPGHPPGPRRGAAWPAPCSSSSASSPSATRQPRAGPDHRRPAVPRERCPWARASAAFLFLADVVFAVFVCALAVHAGTVRLVFAMARDNNLPFATWLGHVGSGHIRRSFPPPDRRPGRGPAGA